MADLAKIRQQYSYAAVRIRGFLKRGLHCWHLTWVLARSQTSSLVIQPTRRRGDGEPTGEAESLAGRLVHRMGDRAAPDRAPTAAGPARRVKKAAPAEGDIMPRKRRQVGARDVLSATEDLETEQYRPKTKETRDAYATLLSAVYNLCGDLSHDEIRS